jgi:hypothetical protein
MLRRAVAPDGPAHVDIASPDPTGFRGATPGQALELDQPADMAVEEWQGSVNRGVIDRQDGFGVPGRGATSLEARNFDKGLKDSWGNQFLGDRPAEDTADPLHPCVNGLPGPASGDELLPDRLQGEWAKLRGRSGAVEFADDSGTRF